MSNARYGLRTKAQGTVASLSQTTFDFDKSAFVLQVDTSIAGETSNVQFKLNFATTGTNTYDVKTSDGQILTAQTGVTTLTFPSAGEYIIQVKGNIEINYRDAGSPSATADRNKILRVLNWGNYTITYPRFSGLNTQIVAKDAPTLGAGTTTLERSFAARIPIGDAIGSWNVSSVTDMNNMFFLNAAFNKNIGSWNTGNVTNMASMFRGATSFNQDIGAWNVGSVTSMTSMFDFASVFNQDISSWNVSNVTDMRFMFFAATPFNQNISSWNVSNVSNFTEMLVNCFSFNQNLGAWQLRTAGTNLTAIFQNTGMNTANYTDTIVGWANYVFTNSGTPANVSMTSQSGRTFTNSRSGGANFADAQAARAYLVSVGWTISGDTVV
jgi:surface protein